MGPKLKLYLMKRPHTHPSPLLMSKHTVARLAKPLSKSFTKDGQDENKTNFKFPESP